jgi:hypothetical protein
MDQGGGSADSAESASKTSAKIFIDFLAMEIVDRARKYTFANWPSITPSAQDMAYAGWWYTNIADRVICIHCDAMFHNWSETDRPYEIHRLKSPQCYYVRTNDNRLSTSQRQIPLAIPSINNTPNVQAIVGAVHAEYSLVVRRHQTFQNWPAAAQDASPSIESFVDAGFFYTGTANRKKCAVNSRVAVKHAKAHKYLQTEK